MPLLYSPGAFESVPRKDGKHIRKKIEWVWAHRKEIMHHPLKDNLSGYFKRRHDPYRIIYSYDNDDDCMIVHLVGTRNTIYDQADKELP